MKISRNAMKIEITETYAEQLAIMICDHPPYQNSGVTESQRNEIVGICTSHKLP